VSRAPLTPSPSLPPHSSPNKEKNARAVCRPQPRPGLLTCPSGHCGSTPLIPALPSPALSSGARTPRPLAPQEGEKTKRGRAMPAASPTRVPPPGPATSPVPAPSAARPKRGSLDQPRRSVTTNRNAEWMSQVREKGGGNGQRGAPPLLPLFARAPPHFSRCLHGCSPHTSVFAPGALASPLSPWRAPLARAAAAASARWRRPSRTRTHIHTHTHTHAHPPTHTKNTLSKKTAAWAFLAGILLLTWLAAAAALGDAPGPAWTVVHLAHAAVSFYLLHWAKGSPVPADQGKYDALTFWEQVRGEEVWLREAGETHHALSLSTLTPLSLFLTALCFSPLPRTPVGRWRAEHGHPQVPHGPARGDLPAGQPRHGRGAPGERGEWGGWGEEEEKKCGVWANDGRARTRPIMHALSPDLSPN